MERPTRVNPLVTIALLISLFVPLAAFAEAADLDTMATLTPTPCVGTCDGGGSVTVDELLVMVNIALGNVTVSACEPGDANRDGRITVDELVAAVSNALYGCGVMPPPPLPTRTRTPTLSPTPTRTPIPVGGLCTSSNPGACSTNNCVDGVCCNQSSCPGGEACNITGHVGNCVTVPTPTPTMRGPGVSCTPAVDNQCEIDLFCVEGVCCDSPDCAAPDQCDIPGFQGQCIPPGSVGDPCSKNSHCETGLICSDAGVCAIPPTATPTFIVFATPGTPGPTPGATVSGNVRMPNGQVARGPQSVLERFAALVAQEADAISGNVSSVGRNVPVTLTRVLSDGTTQTGSRTTFTGDQGEYSIELPSGDEQTCRYQVSVGSDVTLTRAFVFSTTAAVDIDFVSETAVRLILAQVNAGVSLCAFSPAGIQSILDAIRLAGGTATGSGVQQLNTDAFLLAAADPGVQQAVLAASGATPTPNPICFPANASCQLNSDCCDGAAAFKTVSEARLASIRCWPSAVT
jgi:hypothetical protein